jgi:hypothetical protein
MRIRDESVGINVSIFFLKIRGLTGESMGMSLKRSYFYLIYLSKMRL